MQIFPAIDLYESKVVRLYQGDYAQKTVYGTDPVRVALDFKRQGATNLHLVDLEGAKNGQTPNLETVCRIKQESGLFCEIGGGIRSLEVIEQYLSRGLDRVILGTAAVTCEGFVEEAVRRYGDRVAVGVDLLDGRVAIHGWTQDSGMDAFSFCSKMQKLGVRTIICTDISKDGAMHGTNWALYRELSRRLDIDLIASGGVSSLDDVRFLRSLNLYGAIIGKAYYVGAIDLAQAIEVAK